MATIVTNTLEVPGAALYYEVWGSGPTVLCIPGGPTDAGMFSDLANRLADRYAVVCYDPRGHSRSSVHDRNENIPVALHADDAAALITAVADGPVLVYGNSGGGTIGIDLLTRHPELVRRLVAHEAPLLELLPDASRFRTAFAEINDTYRAAGVFAAMGRFGAIVEEGGPKYSEASDQAAPPTADQAAMMERMMGNFELFIAHEVQPIIRYEPQIETLRGLSAQLVSAAGETSGDQAACRAAHALAERVGIEVSSLPGAHGGWGSEPAVFAERLSGLLGPD